MVEVDCLSGGRTGLDGTGVDLVGEGIVLAIHAEAGVDEAGEIVDVVGEREEVFERGGFAGDEGVEVFVVSLVKSELDPREAADAEHVEEGSEGLVIDDEVDLFLVGPVGAELDFAGDGPGAGVVRADVGGGVGEGHGGGGTAVVGGLFEAFNREEDFAHVGPGLEDAVGAVGEDVSDSGAVGDLADEGEDGVIVAPGDGLAVEVVEGEDADLVGLDDGADEVSGGDGVDAELITEAGGSEDGVEAVDAEVGTEHGAGLVFGTFGDGTDVLSLLDEADISAGHGAGEAGGVSDLVAIEHGITVDPVCTIEATGSEVTGREDALGVGVFHDVHEAFVLPELEIGVVSHVVIGFSRLTHECGEIVNGEVATSTSDDRLQVLGSHNGADAGAAGISGPVSVDTGEADEVLAGGSDDGDAEVVATESLLDETLRLEAGLAGEPGHGDDGRVGIVDEEDGQFGGTAYK